jgi:DNA mismatch repair ATPase MutS
VPTPDTMLDIQAGRHPLIAPERVVANDVKLGRTLHVWIITGSNMAGKSTLIRMVGVNVLLAQVGAVAIAEGMTWSPVRLLTDLQARDDLSQDASYFLAEVRQLRRMVLPPDGEAPVLGLIDEPLRGTNSHEQVAAALAVVRHLLDSRHLFLIATHDRKLTGLADGSSAANRHFREDLNADGLIFDFRLHPGPATTRNALRILELEGYPPELVARARQWVQLEDERDDEHAVDPSV